MKKILFIHHAGTIGGSPWSLLYTIKALDKTRYSTHVLFLEPGKVAGLFAAENVPYSELHYKKRFKGYRRFVHIEPDHLNWFQLIPIARRFYWWYKVSNSYAPAELDLLDYDIVHLNSITLIDWARAASRSGKKVIMHVREPLARGLLGLRRSFIRKQIDICCDRVIAISKDNAARVALPDKCTVVYNFSDLDEFSPNVKPLINRENGYFYLLYMGGAKKFKGYELLARSIQHVNQNVKIILAGNFKRMEKRGAVVKIKRYLNRIINQVPDFENIIKDPRVVYVGLSTRVPELIQSCDAVLFPATKTHFPRPLIEGMAMKKIALAFEMEGIDEVVKEGENGFIIRDITPQGLAEGINKLASVSRERRMDMSDFGYQFARSNFSLDNINKITEVYDTL